MNNCDTCRWWKTDEHTEQFFPKQYGACRSPRITTEEAGGDSVRQIAQYEFRGQSYSNQKDIPCSLAEFNSEVHYKCYAEGDDDGAWVAAHDYYHADFLTGPKFGCIHHKPK